MTKTLSDVATIVRNVTGRTDANDPQFPNSVIFGYIADFYSLIMGQEMRFYENRSFYEFNTVIGQTDYTVPGTEYSLFEPPAYIDGFQVQWMQDPDEFFSMFPETQTYDEQRPYAIFFYNNNFRVMPPADAVYPVKITAYKINQQLMNTPLSGGESIYQDYWWRYIAYGAALDLFSDYGELDQWEKYYPIFERYRVIAGSRAEQQWVNQRAVSTVVNADNGYGNYGYYNWF